MSKDCEALDDDELVRESCCGSDEAFQELVRRYKNYIFSLLVRQVRSPDIAEDLSQEVFVNAYRGLQKFRSDSSFKTWITRIALNRSKSYFRSRRYRERQQTLSSDESPIEEPAHFTDTLQLQEQFSFLQYCFGDLSHEMQRVVTLVGFQGQSYEEVSTVLEIPIGTVRSRLNRARLSLMECLRSKGMFGGEE